MQKSFPNIEIILNGGIKQLSDVKSYKKNHVVGVMIGREIYDNPTILLNVDKEIFGQDGSILNMKEAIENMLDYCGDAIYAGFDLNHILRHLKGAFKGTRHSKRFKNILFDRDLSGLEKLRNIKNNIETFN